MHTWVRCTRVADADTKWYAWSILNSTKYMLLCLIRQDVMLITYLLHHYIRCDRLIACTRPTTSEISIVSRINRTPPELAQSSSFSIMVPGRAYGISGY